VTRTGYYWHESCFWHGGGSYAFIVPVGGWVEPLATGALPESPASKRRLNNLVQATGLWDELATNTAEPATQEDLRRVHPANYLDEFKRLSDGGGGELGERTPFGPGGFEMATRSAGLAKQALVDVASGVHRNAYALSRPPGHHCLPDTPMGFCLLANVAIAVEAAVADKLVERVAVVDWDVHHGNGTEVIFYDRPDVLTVSIHQENNYPRPSGPVEARGNGAGEGANLNVPLLPGGGHDAYLYAFDRVIAPSLTRFKPDAIVVACGFDASGVDPLSRMMATARTFAEMTTRLMALADDLCDGRIAMVHEGGYSEVHVPFCGHAVLQSLSGSKIDAGDPLAPRIDGQQPNERFQAFQRKLIDEMAEFFDL